MRATTSLARLLRGVAVAVVLLLLLVACGQKPGVHISAEQGAGGASGELDASGTDTSLDGSGESTAEGEGTIDLSAGDSADSSGDTTGGTTTGGDTTGGTTTGGSSGGTTTGGSTGGDGGGGDDGTSGGTSGGSTSDGGGSREPQGSDRTGVTDESITFGLHAPVTGAAPLPVTSFEKSGDLYYRWVTEKQNGDFLGRKKVNLLFRDDKYDPNSAIQVCRELAQKAFALGGGGGTDQIQACGRFSNQAKVPYFSAGVTENGLRDLPWYFASSMSYKQQGLLLAQFVKKNFPGKKAAAIITDTPNFDDAVAGWEEGVQQQGIPYYKTLRHPKGDSSWYNSFSSELKGAGVEIVYPLTAPVDYIRFAQQASNQGYDPQFVGVGVSMGLNAVLGSGCPEVADGIFFSPFPGLDWARQNTPDFFKAGQEFGAPTDDIALALWGTAKVNHVLMERYRKIYGNDLTREDFRAVVEQQTGVATGVFPELNYSPQNHFGSQQVHVIQANCDIEEHETIATFASGF